MNTPLWKLIRYKSKGFLNLANCSMSNGIHNRKNINDWGFYCKSSNNVKLKVQNTENFNLLAS